MKNNSLEIKTAIQISKSVNDVFEAMVDLVKMSNYLISKSSGRMETGRQIMWQFPEFNLNGFLSTFVQSDNKNMHN